MRGHQTSDSQNSSCCDENPMTFDMVLLIVSSQTGMLYSSFAGENASHKKFSALLSVRGLG